MLMQRLKAAVVIGPADTAPGDHHQIKTHEMLLVFSETLTNHSLDPIAIDGTAGVLFGYSQTQSCMAQTIVPCEHQENVIDGPCTIAKNPTVLVGFH